MKVLTIKQPWASLIFKWGKDIENRQWPLPSWMKGQRVAIHSSKRFEGEEYDAARGLVYDRGVPNFDATPLDMPLGCILGTVLLADCVTASESPWFVGTYGFVLRDPRPLLKPIPARGQLGFWEFDISLAAERAALEGK